MAIAKGRDPDWGACGAGGAPCYADLNELLGKHTAILGSTGAGKSAAVAAIIHGLIQHGEVETYGQWKPQVIVLDRTNEYGMAFKGHRRLSTDEGTLSLPYWLLDLDETIGLLIGKTEYAATSQATLLRTLCCPPAPVLRKTYSDLTPTS